MGRVLFVSVLVLCAASIAAAGPDPYHAVDDDAPPRKRERDPVYDERRDAPDYNPLTGPVDELRAALDRLGLAIEIDSAAFSEIANERADGQRHFETLAWDVVGDWRLTRNERFGTGFVGWNLLGSTGFNYDTGNVEIATDLARATSLNSNIVPDDFAVNEIFWRQVVPNDGVTVMSGLIDFSSWFDTNRAANDAFRQFFAAAFENNASIPWPQYGGFGALVRVELGDDAYAMLGAGESSRDEPISFWKSVGDDWYGLLELGVALDIPALGGGHLVFTPWWSHRSGLTGAGIGVNLDQELWFENVIGFMRVGWGDQDVTEIEVFASGGVLVERPLGRKLDTLGVAVSWMNPSAGAGVRNETLFEAFYEIGLSHTLSLTPDIQVAVHPAMSRRHDVLVVGGLRLEVRF